MASGIERYEIGFNELNPDEKMLLEAPIASNHPDVQKQFVTVHSPSVAGRLLCLRITACAPVRTRPGTYTISGEASLTGPDNRVQFTGFYNPVEKTGYVLTA